MKIFRVTLEPIDEEPSEADPLGAGRSAASAFVVADDAEEALLLLRKDINLSGYRLPPTELQACEWGHAVVRRTLGDSADREKGVYGFTLLDAPTPPLPSD